MKGVFNLFIAFSIPFKLKFSYQQINRYKNIKQFTFQLKKNLKTHKKKFKVNSLIKTDLVYTFQKL